MSRSRNIKPGFFKNERLADLPFEFRLLFEGLWCLADREGRLEDRHRRIKAEVFPYDDVDVDAGLSALCSAGFIGRYKVDDCQYIQVLAFKKHQNPHCKEAASTIPAQCSHGADTVPALKLPEPALLIPDSLNLIPDIGASATSAKSVAKKQTLTAWIADLDGDAILAADPIFDWAGKVGIPRDWIVLAWWSFEGRYTGDGQGHAKKYADWRATFRNAVKDDWLKLWYVGKDGYVLTTAGQQAQREMAA